MLIKLAWRNIWRNKRRSLIVITSIIVGVSAMLLTDMLTIGLVKQIIDNQLSSHVAHIQIHRKGFNDNRNIKNYLPDPQVVEKVVSEEKLVKSFSRRIVSSGLISSARASSGVFIIGVVPEMEKKVTKISSSIVLGKYLSGAPHEIVIGKRLAEKLNVTLGSKVVLMGATAKGNIGSELFKVVGLYETFSSDFDKAFVYIPISDAQKLFGLGKNISEIAIVLSDVDRVDDVKSSLSKKLGSKYEVLTYSEIIPVILLITKTYKEMMWFFYLIIGLAMVFGIINAMLMSVFERVHEVGILMSMGMRSGKIFSMIILEALALGVVGSIAGVVVGGLIYVPLSKYGVDLSIFSESLASFGSGAIIYPVMEFESVIAIFITASLITIAGAIYPALKAIKLEPAEAVRYT